ncbi:GntR family transcriptional regulator [Roseovarius pelagicus]|uniref:GntR family transcriptional regulator n=1 Tax=Roseovarius pelagicus TaxID=2980108 RepID=A0ABY6DG49_9RHOB|nr:GntR family transcriptional regulator [Roseovarius pelagicus]UXX85151.1 GntR family transcriptional regulator [Roseovarius pelagicus]
MQRATGNFSLDGTAEMRLPAHEVIYRQLRDMILYGDLAPGQAVTIQGLTAQLGAGMTPVREAIRRLISQGALEFQGNRRVSVPQLNAANMDEIIKARQWFEPHLTLRAAERAGAADLSHLTAIDTALDAAIQRGDLRAYLELNHRFHSRMYDMAASPILAEIAEGLWLRFGPSMRVVCGRIGTQNLPDMHKETLEAIRAGDVAAAAAAIEGDVAQGMEQLRLSLSADSRSV